MFKQLYSFTQYNYLNLPKQITQNSNITQYTYRADGAKVQKKLPKFECGFVNCYTVTDITDYLDGFQYYRSESDNSGGGGSGGLEELSRISEKLKYAYEQQAYSTESGIVSAQTAPLGITTVKTPQLVFFPTAEGFYDYQKDQYIYQYKDHLGNARISFKRNSAGALEITDANDYYPFGMNHLKTGNAFFGSGSYKNYKYNGKELQESGMYDYGARFYMADLGRWGVIDNKAEKYSPMSPYTYAGNNPIAFIDPDGNELILSFATASAEQSYKDLVKNTLGGKYEAVYTQIAGTSTYKVTLNMINKDASLTKEQQAFYDNYNDIVGAKEVVNQAIVEKSTKAEVGNWQTGDVDMGDIVEFDKAGKGGTSSAGALIHEHVEQFEKSKMGLSNGDLGKTKPDPSAVGGKKYVDFLKAHDKASKAEDKVNGNTRTEANNTSNSNNINVFKEKDGTRTNQALWFPSTGGAEVKKSKLP